MTKFRVLLIGLVLAIMPVFLVNCSGSAKPTNVPPSATNRVRPTIAFPLESGGRTAVPYGMPTIAPEIGNSTKFIGSAPANIGRWVLDTKRSYVNRQFPGGVALIYNVPGLGDIQVFYWLIYVADLPDYNVNNAIDRFNLETSLIKVPMTTVNIGDQAVICPTNRKPAEKTGANPTLLAILQWRNIVIDVYATPDLLKTNFDFSDAEATEFLTKMFNAIPKP